MRQRQISEEEIYATRPLIPHVFDAYRKSKAGLPIIGTGKKVFDDSKAARLALWEERWLRRVFNW